MSQYYSDTSRIAPQKAPAKKPVLFDFAKPIYTGADVSFCHFILLWLFSQKQLALGQQQARQGQDRPDGG